MFRFTSNVLRQDRLRVLVVHKQLVDFCVLVYNQSRAFFPLRSPERRSCVPDWLSFSCSFLARSKLWGSWETRKKRRWKDKCKEVRERYSRRGGPDGEKHNSSKAKAFTLKPLIIFGTQTHWRSYAVTLEQNRKFLMTVTCVNIIYGCNLVQ